MNNDNTEPFFYEGDNGKVALDNFAFTCWLEANHFFKHIPNPKSSFNIVRKEGIFLKIYDEWEVKDYVLKYIRHELKMKKVYNLFTSKTNLFKRDFLSMIETQDIKTLKDTNNTAYLFYQNGVVEVKKGSKQLKQYKDFGLYVWQDQVIKRDYIEADHHESEYRTFIWKISGGFDLPDNPTIEESEKYKQAVERYNSFQSAIGYLLHSYNSNALSKAIILNDELISDDPNGRSGKGLFWNAIKNLKKVQSLNGKSFDFNSAFPYQSVSTDCQVLVFDDVKKGFLFENLFSVTTEGMEITYKGKDTIKLPIEESPKILITTNYTLKGKGGSHDARRFELELSSFFNDKYTPIDLFGHRLFDDWDEKEWARFDCYMIECLKKYLENGLVNYNPISLPLKKLQVDISKELYNCIKDVTVNEWINSDEFYNFYCSTVRRFTEKTKTAVTQSIKKYCEFHGLQYDSVTSNGVKKFMIVQKGLDVKPDLPF